MCDDGDGERKELEIEDASLLSPKLLFVLLCSSGDMAPEKGQHGAPATCQDCPLFFSWIRFCRSSVFPGSLAADCPLPALSQLAKGSCHPGVPPTGTSWTFWSIWGTGLLLSIGSLFSALNLAQAGSHSAGEESKQVQPRATTES